MELFSVYKFILRHFAFAHLGISFWHMNSSFTHNFSAYPLFMNRIILQSRYGNHNLLKVFSKYIILTLKATVMTATNGNFF